MEIQNHLSTWQPRAGAQQLEDLPVSFSFHEESALQQLTEATPEFLATQLVQLPSEHLLDAHIITLDTSMMDSPDGAPGYYEQAEDKIVLRPFLWISEDKKVAQVLAPEFLSEVLFHEMGHRVQYLMKLIGDVEWDEITHSAVKQGVEYPQMAYALEYIAEICATTEIPQRRPREFFAQSYSDYIYRPHLLAQFYPMAYHFLKEKVFHDREYREK